MNNSYQSYRFFDGTKNQVLAHTAGKEHFRDFPEMMTLFGWIVNIQTILQDSQKPKK